MKRYLAFTFNKYYPGGGKNDCIGAFDDARQAMDVAEVDEWGNRPEYLHILDTQTGNWHFYEGRSDETPGRCWRLLGKQSMEDVTALSMEQYEQGREEREAKRERLVEAEAKRKQRLAANPVEAMLQNRSLKTWAVECHHAELSNETASIIVDAYSMDTAIRMATEALGLAARLTSIECMGPSQNSAPQVVVLEVRR